MAKSVPTRQQRIYDNCAVYAIDGTLLFRCSHKKLQWYLDRNLATRLDDQSIRLSFTTKGAGREGQTWYLEDRTDQCVVCGATDDGLTLLHIVPAQYRRHMPLCVKSHSNIDNQPFCVPCLRQYEVHTMALKKQLALQYNAPLEGGPWLHIAEHHTVRKAASALLKSSDKLPTSRRIELTSIVSAHCQAAPAACRAQGSWGETQKEVLGRCSALEDRVRGPGFEEHGRTVVLEVLRQRDRVVRQTHGCSDMLLTSALSASDESGADTDNDMDCDQQQPPVVKELPLPLPAGSDPLVQFIKLWRSAFLHHAQPRFLSPAYDIDTDVYNP
ncbi:hypothetical protein RI367_000631 [Sorochytrium milnesiophthora]